MKRRDFIRNTSLGAIGTSYIPMFLRSSDRLFSNKGFRKLIIIQLSGGNDGLNTIIPFENDNYYNLRPKLGIKKSDVLKASDELGFNPAMKDFHTLYNDGYVSVINSVGYPNPNRSHFRSMDIWQSASDANEYLRTGWVGRYLDTYCNNSHAALEIDAQLSMSLNGGGRSGLAVTNSQSLFRSLRGPYFEELIDQSKSAELDEDNLGYLYKTLVQTDQSAGYLKDTHKVKDNNYTFPKTQLGRRLATVSQFIRSGFNTQVYYVSHNGFDSHSNQRNSQDRLLLQYSEGVNAFVKSLEKSGHMEDVLIMTFSEFGRRVEENASAGTDHGKANNLFLIGKNMSKKGFYNSAPDLINLDDGDIGYKVDFRSVYAEVIKKWMGKDPNLIMSRDFDELGIV